MRIKTPYDSGVRFKLHISLIDHSSSHAAVQDKASHLAKIAQASMKYPFRLTTPEVNCSTYIVIFWASLLRRDPNILLTFVSGFYFFFCLAYSIFATLVNHDIPHFLSGENSPCTQRLDRNLTNCRSTSSAAEASLPPKCSRRRK